MRPTGTSPTGALPPSSAHPHTVGSPPSAGLPATLELFFAVGETRVPVTVPYNAKVGEVKALLRRDTLAEQARGKMIRLIASGRILSDDTATLSSYVTDGTVVHVLLTANSGSTGEMPPRVADVAGSTAPPIPVAGFERLALLGLDAEEISNLRALYQPEVNRDFPATRFPLLPGEDERARMQRCEDMWMRAQHPVLSEFALNLRPLLQQRGVNVFGGTRLAGSRTPFSYDAEAGGAGDDDDAVEEVRVEDQSSFFCGAMVGLTLGFFALILLLWFSASSRAASTRRLRLGILAGATLNLIFAALNASSDAGGETNDGKGGDAGGGTGRPLLPIGPGG